MASSRLSRFSSLLLLFASALIVVAAAEAASSTSSAPSSSSPSSAPTSSSSSSSSSPSSSSSAGKRKRPASEQPIIKEKVKLDSEHVTDLSLRQLALIGAETNWPVFVLFAKLDQPASQTAWVAFKDAAASLGGVVPSGFFDCKLAEHEEVCKNFCGQSFPKVVVFPAGKDIRPIYYSYDYRPDLMVDFVLGTIDTYIADVEENEIGPFLRKASGFPRVLFFTFDKFLDPRINTMAFQHRLRMIFAKVTDPSAAVLRSYNLTKTNLPTAVVVPQDASIPPIKLGRKLSDSSSSGWEELGKLLQRHTRGEVAQIGERAPLEYHQSFSTPRKDSGLEMLDAAKFEREVFEINGTKTVVFFFHNWMVSSRRLLSVYQDLPPLFSSSPIEVAALDLDKNDSRYVQTKFSLFEIPAIAYFPGNSEGPFKMTSLDRSVKFDKPVTAEEIAEWVREQDAWWAKQKQVEAEEEAERLREAEKRAIEREKMGLPREETKGRAKQIILDLEDSTEEEEGAEVEKHYVVNLEEKGDVLRASKVDL